jgi:tRNA A-37 threonylcarbamoyl transferase component Bud32
MTIALWIAFLSAVTLLGVIGGMALRRSRYLDVNPRYRRSLATLGLTEIEQFLDLPSVIVSGHPNRNVARVTLGRGSSAIEAFLKREHRVLWRDYLSSFLAGFGPVSRSGREARLLDELRRAGGHGPEVIAVGQDGRGRAFLLVRTLDGAAALRDLLRQRRVTSPAARLSLARALGRELARVHAAGFHHADLNSTHVFIGADERDIAIVDWQRSQRRGRVSWRARVQDLAALDATLADDLATPRERLTTARAYLRAARVTSSQWRHVLTRVRRRSREMQKKRYVRELRSAPLPTGGQNLVWLDGEALCVTPEYQAELKGQVPRWLLPLPPNPGLQNWVCRQRMPRERGGDALLVQRICDRPARWLWDCLRGRRFTTPELRQAALIFRLQRYGIRVPRLLAMGQRHVRPWHTESFLLTEPLANGIALADWLATRGATGIAFAAERKQALRLVREAGSVLRRLHDAGCYLAGRMPLAALPDGSVAVVAVEDLRVTRQPRPDLARADLAVVGKLVVQATRHPRDALRLLRGYRGATRLAEDDKRLLRTLTEQD